MMILKYILFVYFFYICVDGKDNNTINFIKMFIENEDKPTHLTNYKLCWKIYDQLKLIREVAKLGVRSTSATGLSKYHEHMTLFLADLECPGAEDIIGYAAIQGLFRSPYRWLAISPPVTDRGNLSFLWEIPLLVDSDFVLAETTEDGYKLSELHKPSLQQPMEVTPRGVFNGTYVDIRPRRELFQRRRDLKRHVLVMSNVIQESNTTKDHLEDLLEPQYDSITKVCWSNVKAAFNVLNATPAYIYSYRWGYKQNGKWSGIIEDLRSGRADLGTNCLIKADRLEVVSFTDTVAPYRLAFVFRQPPLSYVANIFSMPFSSNVWLALIVCVGVATTALFLTSQHEARFGKSSSQLDGSVGDALLLTMSAVSQQGCFLEPKKASGRITVVVLFTGLMALYAAYSANVLVLLQAPSNSIRTLSQLAHSKITLAANDVDYNYFLLKANKDDIPRTEIVRRVFPKKGKKPFYELKEGVEKIQQGLFAFHSIVEPVYRHIEKTFLEMEKCDLMEVDFLNDFSSHIPMKKDSPYLELMRVTFKQLRETGIVSVTAARFLVPRPRCTDMSSVFSSVGLLELKPVVLLMIFGFALALAVCLAELVFFRVNERVRLFVCYIRDFFIY